jgi:apolipoprotein N-acyltransferase
VIGTRLGSPPLPAALLVSAGAGALTVFAFAPFQAWWLAVLTLAALFALVLSARSTRHAIAIGGGFGLGLNLAGVSWIYISLHVVGGMPAPLAIVALAGFAGYLALYVAVASAFIHRTYGLPRWLSALTIPSLWTASEWAKSTVMSGFPWLNVGTAQVDSPLLMGYAPIVGAYGLSFLVALAATLLAFLIQRPQRWSAWAMLLIVVVGGLALARVEWSVPEGRPVTVALLQGNVEQVMKWREGERERALENYLDLANTSRATLVVLPETALPVTFERLSPDYLARLTRPARDRNGAVIVGVVTRDFHGNGFHYYNTAVALGSGREQRYSKHHLVAFGEFIPPAFGWVYRWLNMPMANFSAGTTQPQPMQFPWGLAAINICYEDAFGHEIIRQLPQAHVLINLTNVAWFGRSLAADQHAQFSRLRSLETGRPTLRSTNTGLTAIIDHRGRTVAALPQFTRGALTGEFQPMSGTTPYVRWGDWPLLLGVASLLLLAWQWRRLRTLSTRLVAKRPRAQ